MNAIILPEQLYQRAEEQAAERGATVETLVMEALEAYLDDLQDRAEAEATLARIQSGEESLMTWETYHAIENPEERADVLAVIAAKRAVDQGDDELLDLDETLAELDAVQG